MLPGARVIHCVRDARDTCVSCFMQDFGAGLEFTQDLAVLRFRRSAIVGAPRRTHALGSRTGLLRRPADPISDFPGEEINLIPSRYQPPEEDLGDDEPQSPFQVDQRCTWAGLGQHVARIADGDDVTLAALEAALPDGARALTAAGRTRATAEMSKAFMTNLTAMSLLALLVGLFLIFNSVNFSVLQRRDLIGVLRALGLTRRQLLAMILVEAAVLGTVAAVLGLLLGVGTLGLLLGLPGLVLGPVGVDGGCRGGRAPSDRDDAVALVALLRLDDIERERDGRALELRGVGSLALAQLAPGDGLEPLVPGAHLLGRRPLESVV